jgi:hypothetical protein
MFIQVLYIPHRKCYSQAATDGRFWAWDIDAETWRQLCRAVHSCSRHFVTSCSCFDQIVSRVLRQSEFNVCAISTGTPKDYLQDSVLTFLHRGINSWHENEIMLLPKNHMYSKCVPILVADRSNARVCGHSLAEIAGSNPAGAWMFV